MHGPHDLGQRWDIGLHDLTLGYGDSVVLDKLNATLPAGKISVILGGSGCGKSTLLRHILGLNKPKKGNVLLGGKDLFSLSGKEFRRLRRRMGVLFQDGALLGSLTLGDNVALPLAEHTALDKDTINTIVRHKLSLVGLADFAHYYPSQLSGGMRKRAGLARAIVMDPPILLCDEPTSGLDPINAAQMDALLLEMKKRFPDMTIVVVSHDLQSLDSIADYVLVLNEKHAVYEGDLQTLRQSEDPFLRQFLDRKAGAPQSVDAPLGETVRKALADWLDS
ncbi:ABC transporter ATP-binding protein [Oleidesulfovibrio alaskensis]|uniref:ABC transporter ATP-binding protein n=1 Tax=Oleidesulfovibrio alaskensis TaxID=58180 RepID=UPI001A60308D|nr:ABC transporter ATP-binding protein [Oleidesulfovibrio alaskensis]MBL3581315.1 ABC transporter ATP-binding protein [Oleidesulfovibrio alaskensis]